VILVSVGSSALSLSSKRVERLKDGGSKLDAGGFKFGCFSARYDSRGAACDYARHKAFKSLTCEGEEADSLGDLEFCHAESSVLDRFEDEVFEERNNDEILLWGQKRGDPVQLRRKLAYHSYQFIRFGQLTALSGYRPRFAGVYTLINAHGRVLVKVKRGKVR